MRTDLVEGLGRVSAMESSVQKIREVQEGQHVKNKILELVDTQLQIMQAQVEAKVQDWAMVIGKGCQELEDRLDGIQMQLEVVQQRQNEHQSLFDAILPRLEQLEAARLQFIP